MIFAETTVVDTNTTAIILAAFGVMGTSVAALAWGFRYMLVNMKPLIEKNIVATDKNTRATAKADIYLRHRNGRDMEAHKQLLVSIKKIADTSVKTVLNANKK